jgi:hypothetical protein
MAKSLADVLDNMAQEFAGTGGDLFVNKASGTLLEKRMENIRVVRGMLAGTPSDELQRLHGFTLEQQKRAHHVASSTPSRSLRGSSTSGRLGLLHPSERGL